MANPIQDANSRRASFEPYRSVLTAVIADRDDRDADVSRREQPPWRRKMGQVWFSLNSEQGMQWGEEIPKEEEDGFEALVESMFRNRAGDDEWAVPILDIDDHALSVEVDVRPERGAVLGDSSISFNREAGTAAVAKPSRPRWADLETILHAWLMSKSTVLELPGTRTHPS